jgi:hypothetical protein
VTTANGVPVAPNDVTLSEPSVKFVVKVSVTVTVELPGVTAVNEAGVVVSVIALAVEALKSESPA